MVGRSILALLVAAFLSLGAAGDFPIPSECAVGMYLPPIPGTPDDDTQEIALVPESTTTFRLRYGATPGTMTTYATGGSSGQSVTANTRGEFTLTSLTADTTYHWRVECSENGRWKRGWEGSFTTTPTTDNEVRLLIGTDAHWLADWMYDPGFPVNSDVQRTLNTVDLMARHRDVHAYLENGDWLHFHCRLPCAEGYQIEDDFGRPFGSYSIPISASTQAESIAFGEARASWVLRKMWRSLRFMSLVVSRGNHDIGGAFGGNGVARGTDNTRHLQWRAEVPWVDAGINVQLGSAGDLDDYGVFSYAGHGMGDGDGPYRWAPANTIKYTNLHPPMLGGCGGARVVGDYSNEWYVDLTGLGDQANTFRLAYCDTCAGCTVTSSKGAGHWARLVRGSNMQYETKQVTAKYLPNQNEVLAHGWGDAEDGIMGPVRFSDYVVVINLDEYDHTPPPAYRPGLPLSNRSEVTGWSLGTNQKTGAIDLINDLGVGATGYDNVEVAIVLMHHTPGGHADGPGMPYGRGGACEPDSHCWDAPATECEDDADCAGGGGRCEPTNCAADFAHADWQDVHDALDAFQSRTNGVALVVLGHDHQNSGGKKDGVFYYTAGQLGSSVMASWGGFEDHVRRYDYDHDGVPAYQKNYAELGYGGSTYAPSSQNNFPTEWGTEFRGYSLLTICPATGVEACSSGKTEIVLDYYISAYENFPALHGSKAYTFTLQGTQP